MIIESVELKNFRNYKSLQMDFDSGTNILYGDNAQGKTNILESLYLSATTKSHKGSKDKELINFDSDEAHIKTIINKKDIPYRIDIHLKKNSAKGIAINGMPIKKASELFGILNVVFFSPEDLNLIKNGPAERRRFLDIAISQLKPKYAVTLSQYNKAVAQRNVLLKDIQLHSELYDTLDIWEDRIAFFASEIIRQRLGYINKLSSYTDEIYSGLSSGKEKLDISYDQQTVVVGETKQELYENMKNQLYQARKNDLVTGFTSVGPHRDDLSIKIDRLSARNYGSQGQQRSAALALKLGEAAVIKNFSDVQPVALLDDVMSELDTSRQNYILNHIRDWQVFITCWDPTAVKNLKYGMRLEMKDGICKKK